MNYQEFIPFHNRLVKYTGQSGVTGTGVFLDALSPNEKLFPEDVIFVPEENMEAFKEMTQGMPRESVSFESAIKTFGKRVDLLTFSSLVLVHSVKLELITKWKHILTTNKKFQAYIRLEEIDFKDDHREIPKEYGGLVIVKRISNDATVVQKQGDYEYLISDYSRNEHLNEKEFIELFDLFEKQRLFA